VPAKSVKRVFTKMLFWNEEIPDETDVTKRIADRFVAQEDIIILGCMLHNQMHFVTADSAKSQYRGLGAILSQQGEWGKDGDILRNTNEIISVSHDVTVAGTEVPMLPFKEASLMFPAGFGVPIKEEGSVYLNVSYWNAGGSAKTFSVYALIYYVKGKAVA